MSILQSTFEKVQYGLNTNVFKIKDDARLPVAEMVTDAELPLKKALQKWSLVKCVVLSRLGKIENHLSKTLE